MNRQKLWDVLWLTALVLYILAGITLVPFHGDEATLIYMSRDYAYQFMERDLERIAYSDTPASPTEQNLRLLNGTTHKYLYGLAWHAAGFSLEDLNEQWDWGMNWDDNERSGHIPSPDLLHTTRWPSALMLAGGVLVMFALGNAAGGRPTAYLASAYYALHPVLLLNGRRAMMEGGLLLFSLLVLLAGIWFLRNYSWRAALALGVFSGLAIASKHTAVLTVGAVFFVCLLDALIGSIRQPGREHTYRAPAQLFVAGGLALLVFYLLNPAWWDDPVSRALVVVELRQNLLELQMEHFGRYADFADQVGGFMRQALIGWPQYYEVPAWSGYDTITAQIAAYESSPWRGVTVGGSPFGALLLVALLALGLSALLRDSQRPLATRGLVGGWALVMIGSTLLLTPVEWQRYYVPVFPAFGLLAARGLVFLLEALRSRWRTG